MSITRRDVLAIDLGKDREQVRPGSVRDSHLGGIENIMPAGRRKRRFDARAKLPEGCQRRPRSAPLGKNVTWTGRLAGLGSWSEPSEVMTKI